MSFEYTEAQIEQWNTAAAALLQRVDAALSLRTVQGELQACRLLVEEGSGILDKDRSLFILSLLLPVEMKELEGDTARRVFEKRSVSEVRDLYENLVFCLRRIEFDFPEEYCMELRDIVVSEQVSADLLYTVIENTRYLYGKEKIVRALGGILI